MIYFLNTRHLGECGWFGQNYYKNQVFIFRFIVSELIDRIREINLHSTDRTDCIKLIDKIERI